MASTKLIAAMIFGVAAVLLGGYHGYSETLQGSVAPTSILINAIGGTECEPNCLLAMTIIPNFLAAGIATIIVGVIMLGWIVIRLNAEKGGPSHDYPFNSFSTDWWRFFGTYTKYYIRCIETNY
tara:strand:+ start:1837 stop:2208 length:372 start_codon:yes stop_codon:yes gene_type:complete